MNEPRAAHLLVHTRPGDAATAAWSVGLEAWAGLSMPDRLHLFASTTTSPAHCKSQLAALLQRKAPAQRRALLVSLVARIAPTRLAWTADFLKGEAAQLQVLTSRA